MRTTWIIVSLFLLFECSAKADDLKVGWIGPLTGGAAILGVDAVPAIEMAVDEINSNSKQKIKLFIEDDSYETHKTVSAYQSLVHQKNVKVLFVFSYGGLMALASRAQADGVLLIDTLDCDQKIAALPENTICISKSTENLGETIAKAAVKTGNLPGGIIYYESDPFMGTVGTAAINYLKNFDITAVPYAEGYAAGTTDFRSMLLRAHAKGAKSLFFFGYDEMGLAMKQAREIGLKENYFALNTVSSPGFKIAAQGTEIGSIVATFRAPRTKDYEIFSNRFKAKTGREVAFEVSTFPSYDVVKLIGTTLPIEGNSAEAVQKIKKMLYGVQNYQGLSGSITVDADGACRSIKNSAFRLEKNEMIPL
jgi:branched-chain amino acid transport system substrate-binding protein